MPKPRDPAAQVAAFDAQLAELQVELARVADLRAQVIADLVSSPGMTVRRAADVLGISPTSVQKAVDRARAAGAA